MNYDEISFLFDEMNEKPIAFHRVYAKITGRAITGLVLSQLVYWSKTMGWKEFYKTDASLSEEIGASVEEIKGARAALIKLGILTAERRGIPAKMYYKLDKTALISLITSQREFPNKSTEIPEHTYTENNTENNTYKNSVGTFFSNNSDEPISYHKCFPDGTPKSDVRQWKRERKELSIQKAKENGMKPIDFLRLCQKNLNSPSAVVATYFKIKNRNFKNIEQLFIEFNEVIKTANELMKGYTYEEIEDAMLEIDKQYKEKNLSWKLSTLKSNINELKTKSR